ncbi:transcription-repair coupling factor [Thermosulfurimonas dismutans]|uniref:Transcription-repair-coupling factor n=1 Tax=Thermosulfurimonas dismutans TaxID=999894 RepID=A0A179D3A5_9BACT|nr:transcription-repair coupling factor [Thermosulfurimonas dismutans]OAQ20463.1 Transcription-repair coupling factor [Thermosulfurimonas dismutans]
MDLPRNFKAFEAFLDKKHGLFSVSGFKTSSLAFFLSRFSLPKPILLIFPDDPSAREFVAAFSFFSSESVKFFPSPEHPPFAEVLPDPEEGAGRIEILYDLLLERPVLIATSVKGLLRRLPPRELLRKVYEYLIPGEDFPREGLLDKLVALGYERVGVVQRVGEFAVKGAVLDVWPPGYEKPLRFDFFGDTLEKIKTFSPENQLTEGKLEEAYLFPVREVFFVGEAEVLYERLLLRAEKFKIPAERVETLREQISLRRFLEPEEFWLPILFERTETLFDYLPEKSLLILYEPEKIQDEAGFWWGRVLSGGRRLRGRLLLEPEEAFLSPELLEHQTLKWPFKVLVRELPVSGTDIKANFKGLEAFEPVDSGKSGLERGLSLLKRILASGEHLVVALGSRPSAERLVEIFVREGLCEELPIKEAPFPEPNFRVPAEVIVGELPEGFFAPDLTLVFVSERELFGKKKPPVVKRRLRERTGLRFEDLKPGDYVVHREHGIGLYRGLVKLEVGDVPGEFLLVEYAGGDKLYLPVDRLGEIHRYVGVDERPPKLDRLGGRSFLARKEKVKKAVQEIAQELVALYAARKVARGHAFSPPDLTFREFEAAFPYEETPDQEAAIEEVLADMQSPRPMDRLLAGDVGYGKTEVALRATMLAVRDGKQVAVLVPTTVLAEQHYRTFSERLAPFGVKVAVLSRLRPPAEQKEVLKKLASGEVQVVIGTHRLLSTDVRFKDLGLLIIDEEHRFGVKQKERLKELKKTVDVLALSATPIPRTLQLSLLGVRDLSVIETPPPGRLPVKTVLAKMEPEVVEEAIRRELSRGGQVFFVYPRVKGLHALANWVKRLVPEARVALAHGQMPPKELEEIMTRFVRREIDVLVCTTIIESGLDIPSANTIIIARADRFGLSEIYQLRGRVGRGKVQAYAYLLVPSLSGLTEEARKRLKALMQFTDLGSGFRLALSDLKIRGAGNLLGVSQSGHIAAVGYDLYLEILEKAVREMKGERIEEAPEPEVNLGLPAYFPEAYVPDVEQRLHLYRELSLVRDEEELEAFRTSLIDRFGELPPEGENLIKLTRLKILLRKLRVLKLEARGKELVFHLGDEVERYKKGIRELSESYRFVRLVRENRLRIRVEDPLLSEATKIAEILQKTRF